MRSNIIHITTVHYRYDVRIFHKYCMMLANDKNYNVTLLVADGNGKERVGELCVNDLGNLSNGRILRFILGNFKVLRYLLKFKYDIMHFHDPELLPVIFIMKMLGKKVVFDMHENLPLQILTKSYLSRTVRTILSFFVKNIQYFLFHHIPVIFAEISYVAYFPSVKKSEIILNYPLIYPFDKIVLNKSEKFTLGYMGGINIERGTLITLSSLEKLRKTGIDVYVHFIGPINDEIIKSDLYTRAVRQGWARFYGRLNATEGWSIMAQCNAGLAILQDSPNFIGSYPTKLFEYMLLELPIIVSNFPLYKDIIDESRCGIVVKPSSIEEVSNAILWLKNNPDEAKLMGYRGRMKAIEKYNWESEFLKLKRFYKSILNKKVLSNA